MNTTLALPAGKTTSMRAEIAAPSVLDVFGLPVLGVAATAFVYRELPPCGAMCLWAMVLFYAFKWITYRSAPAAAMASRLRTLWYFFAWSGLDAAAFLSDRKPRSTPTVSGWLSAGAMTGAGMLAVCVAASLTESPPLVVGWLGMIGIVATLHFGFFRLAALAWQSAGVAAEPVMDRPLAAATLAEFWDRRWNKAFRDLAHRLVFEPLVRRTGPRWAIVACFAFSGLIHDAVISLPARAGYGLPTAYFLVQAGAILCARSAIGARCGVQRGFGARAYAALVIIGPLGLLFHASFVRVVVVPMLRLVAISH